HLQRRRRNPGYDGARGAGAQRDGARTPPDWRGQSTRDPDPGLLAPGAAAHRVVPDHVLGVSSASTSLARLTIREPVRRALDLGTGCGVQALHLAAPAERVVATDVNQRALWMTQL